MDEASAIQWCSDIVDTRFYEVLHHGGKERIKMARRRHQHYAALAILGADIYRKGKYATSRSNRRELTEARFFLL